MRNQNEINDEILRLISRQEALYTYREHCIRIDDHHGVQDASSDLREIVTAINTLRWVVGAEEKIGV